MEKYVIAEYMFSTEWLLEDVDGFGVVLTKDPSLVKIMDKQEAELLAERFGMFVFSVSEVDCLNPNENSI